MKISFLQFNCTEGPRPDFCQSNAILRHNPDVIILEQPESKGSPNSVFNRYSCKNKPLEKVFEKQRKLKKSSKRFGYALSDIKLWDNIMFLWKEGYDVKIYNVDAPEKFRKEFFEVWQNCYPCASKNWLWWVKIYIRERIMANHMKKILYEYSSSGKDKIKILIFLESFHWKHVKFLLNNPLKKEIWRYYFGKFNHIVKRKNIAKKIKKENRLFYKYWLKYSDF